MFKFLIILLFTFSLTAKARPLEFAVKMKYVNGERTIDTASKISSELGKAFTISRNGLVAEIHPTLFDTTKLNIETNDLVKLKARVYRIVNGNKELIARPEIITKLGSESSFEIKKESGEVLLFEITSSHN